MANDVEFELMGGAQTAGVVRIGETVHRPAHPYSRQTQALLQHLEAAGFQGAPRALGFDELGREVLTYIDGDVLGAPPYRLSGECLLAAARLVSALHDAAASSPLAAGQETVCHGDLGPHNTVFRDGLPIAFIDWDEDLVAGRRAVDFAHAVWCFADLTEPGVPVATQARNTQLMCTAYPGMTPRIVVDELMARFHRARAQHEAAGRGGGVAVFERLIRWIDHHGDRIINDPAPR